MTSGTQLIFTTFGSQFLDTYAPRIISDPRTALTELVANAWDAGAINVDISWPSQGTGQFSIQDDGTGMTEDQLRKRWMELAYNRRREQGSDVEFPPDIEGLRRRAYGRNGKGRHAMFCFANKYVIKTWRDGRLTTWTVSRSEGAAPFTLELTESKAQEGHGTRLSAEIERHHLSVDQVRDHLGSRFVSDPKFRVSVNSEALSLSDRVGLPRMLRTPHGDVSIFVIDSNQSSTRSDFHGVAWWVNGRLVGSPDWIGHDGEMLIDRRTTTGKRLTFVIEADILEDHILDDWTSFKDDAVAHEVRGAVEQEVKSIHLELTGEDRRQVKRIAFSNEADKIRPLSQIERLEIGRFVDGLQQRVPTVTADVLTAAVDVLATMELARSKFSLLERLSKLSHADIDQLELLLQEWTVAEIHEVVKELDTRIRVIRALSEVIGKEADELKVIQPLFERSLWVFGPEYDGVEYVANRRLSTIMRKFFGEEFNPPQGGARRPDIITTSDSSLELYTSHAYGNDGEIDGIHKVLILELKKGNSTIGIKETRQAEDYALALQGSGHLSPQTRIHCWVLGDRIHDDVKEDGKRGTIEVRARTFGLVLEIADRRVFNLRKRIDQISSGIILMDNDVERVLAERLDLSVAG